jgi:hypothetical protein
LLLKNTEAAIQLCSKSSKVQFGGALYQKAGAQIVGSTCSVNTPAEKTVGLFGRLQQAAGSLVGQLAIAASAAGLVRTDLQYYKNSQKKAR